MEETTGWRPQREGGDGAGFGKQPGRHPVHDGDGEEKQEKDTQAIQGDCG